MIILDGLNVLTIKIESKLINLDIDGVIIYGSQHID
jgi:hypothetical protein